jgi:hypothetical protein
VVLLEDLLKLLGKHALESQHLHLGEDAFSREEISEVTASMSV